MAELFSSAFESDMLHANCRPHALPNSKMAARVDTQRHFANSGKSFTRPHRKRDEATSLCGACGRSTFNGQTGARICISRNHSGISMALSLVSGIDQYVIEDRFPPPVVVGNPQWRFHQNRKEMWLNAW
jgi:hypothetical protein